MRAPRAPERRAFFDAATALELLHRNTEDSRYDFFLATSRMPFLDIDRLLENAAQRFGIPEAKRIAMALSTPGAWLVFLVKHCLPYYNRGYDVTDDMTCEAAVQDLTAHQPEVLNPDVRNQRDNAVQADAKRALQLLEKAGPHGLGAFLAKQILSFSNLPWEEYMPDTPAWAQLRRNIRAKEHAPMHHLGRQFSKNGGCHALRGLKLVGNVGML
jgi:hypothetical protein